MFQLIFLLALLEPNTKKRSYVRKSTLTIAEDIEHVQSKSNNKSDAISLESTENKLVVTENNRVVHYNLEQLESKSDKKLVNSKEDKFLVQHESGKMVHVCSKCGIKFPGYNRQHTKTCWNKSESQTYKSKHLSVSEEFENSKIIVDKNVHKKSIVVQFPYTKNDKNNSDGKNDKPEVKKELKAMENESIEKITKV